MKYFYLFLIVLLLSASGLNACNSPYQADMPEGQQQDSGPDKSGSQIKEPGESVIAETDLLSAGNFEYLGAFRLPEASQRPDTFDYGGGAITFYPDGDPGGENDGFSGSLFIMGHPRLPYGELPDGNKVAEISIPTPVISDSVDSLNTAGFIQGFSNVAGGLFETLNELPRNAMQYFKHPSQGESIHLAWGAHFQEDSQTQIASHASFNTDLSGPDMKGTWYIGNQSLYSVNNYMLDIPVDWADKYLGGFYLATGRFRDGGWSGMGPALFAYNPWSGKNGSLAESGARLEVKTLLLYETTINTDNIENCLDNYQHPDEWEGAAWITTVSGKVAVLFAGTKGVGDKYWYGFLNPDDAAQPCVEGEMIGQLTVCRNADGSPCTEQYLKECSNHTSERGWWSSGFSAQFLLYDPAQLTRVAAGQLEPWEPQPYEIIPIDSNLFLNPSGIETDMLGTGQQRRYRIGDITFDRKNSILYVLELFADNAKPVVHVWKIK